MYYNKKPYLRRYTNRQTHDGMGDGNFMLRQQTGKEFRYNTETENSGMLILITFFPSAEAMCNENR